MKRISTKLTTAAMVMAGACATWLAPAETEAAVVFQYAVEPSTNVTAPAGQIAYDIYFEEVLTEDSSSFFGDAAGLDAAAFLVQRLGGDGTQISDLVLNPAFDAGEGINMVDVAPLEASATEAVGFGSDPVMLDGSGRAYLGSVLFEAAGGEGPATWSVDLYSDFGGNVIASNGTSLDIDPGDGSFVPLSGGVTFEVAAIPEPASLGGLAATGLLLCRRRR